MRGLSKDDIYEVRYLFSGMSTGRSDGMLPMAGAGASSFVSRVSFPSDCLDELDVGGQGIYEVRELFWLLLKEVSISCTFLISALGFG